MLHPFQKPDAVDEAASFADHHKVDGVEVLPAGEASTQIGLFFSGRMKSPANGALKPKIAAFRPACDGKRFNQRVYRNHVPKCVKLL